MQVAARYLQAASYNVISDTYVYVVTNDHNGNLFYSSDATNTTDAYIHAVVKVYRAINNSIAKLPCVIYAIEKFTT